MTQQALNAGSQPGDNTGDTLRAAALKINANTTELYGLVASNTSNITAQATALTAETTARLAAGALTASRSLDFWFPVVTGTVAKIAKDPMTITLANCVATAGTAAQNSTTLDVRKNNVSIGSLVFGPGSNMGTLTIGTPANLILLTGDVLEIVAPGTQDPALTRVAIVVHN